MEIQSGQLQQIQKYRICVFVIVIVFVFEIVLYLTNQLSQKEICCLESRRRKCASLHCFADCESEHVVDMSRELGCDAKLSAAGCADH